MILRRTRSHDLRTLLCSAALLGGCQGEVALVERASLEDAALEPYDGGRSTGSASGNGYDADSGDAEPVQDDASAAVADSGTARACDAESPLSFQGQASYPASTSFDTPFDCGSAGTLLEAGGPPENRVNLLILGDGYRQSELEATYTDHASRFVKQMFSAEGEPYLQYRKYINVCRLNVASAQSGTDIPDENVQVDTAFDGNGSDRTRLGLIDPRKVNAALDRLLSGTRMDPDWIAVSLNVSRWFNSGGSIMVWAGANPGKPDVALHEAGHSFHALADEYGGNAGTYSGEEPREINVTADPGAARWKHWLGYEQPGVGRIGAFEGGRYFNRGVYRPSPNSKMNQVPALHNAPCMEKVVQDIYRLVRPVDAWTKNDAELLNPCTLALVLVDPARVKVEWKVDGQGVVTTDPSLFDAARQLSAPGQYTVSARVHDDTSLVRGERTGLEQTISWSVRVP